MKRHTCLIFAAFSAAVLLVSVSGCSRKSSGILDPYTAQLSREALEIGQLPVREDGITDGICIVSNESSYNPEEISARAAVCFNITQKETLYSKNSFEQFPMASLTKLMTALLAFESGDLDRTVTLGDEVVITTYDAWLCGFQPGDEVSLRDLVKAALIYSGNDAANAVAVAVGGSLEQFVDQMNAEAKRIGATDTQFKNPNGLDQNGHYSSAYDLYLIFNECLKYPDFRQIIPTPVMTCSYRTADGENVVRKFKSGNGYLAQTAIPPDGIKVYGGKTGHTEKALDCLATLASDQNGDEYITIILGAETKQQVYAQTNQLLDKIP